MSPVGPLGKFFARCLGRVSRLPGGFITTLTSANSCYCCGPTRGKHRSEARLHTGSYKPANDWAVVEPVEAGWDSHP
jgi:hypothetical protein